MKKLLVSVLLVACSAGMVWATDYNPTTDWVLVENGDPVAWDFGARIETGYGTGVFGDFLPGIHSDNGTFDDWYTIPGVDDTCNVAWFNPWPGGNPGPLMNAWTFYQATARVTPEAGTYDLVDVSFLGAGYAAPTDQTTNVYVVKNGTEVLWKGLVHSDDPLVYPSDGTSLQNLIFAPGDYLDFISANGSDAGESRTILRANLVLVPEPVTMMLLGLGGLGLIRRRRA